MQRYSRLKCLQSGCSAQVAERLVKAFLCKHIRPLRWLRRYLFDDVIRDPCFDVAPPPQNTLAQPQLRNTVPDKEYTQNSDIRDHTVLWISRAKFEHTHRLSHWQAPRRLQNEGQIIKRLQETILDWNDRTCLMQTDNPDGKLQHNLTLCRPGRTFFRLQTVRSPQPSASLNELRIPARPTSQKCKYMFGKHENLPTFGGSKPPSQALVHRQTGAVMCCC